MEHALVKVVEFMENINLTPAKPEPKEKKAKTTIASPLTTARRMEPSGQITPRTVATLTTTAAATRTKLGFARQRKTRKSPRRNSLLSLQRP